MCGICGIYNFQLENSISQDILTRMTNILSHRGPDDEGFFVDGSVGLGHRRLSIIDLNTGQQPMFNEDKSVCIVFNGEIYNFRELQRGLISKGHKFRTHSDTECIVHGYEELGTEIVAKLRGMFSFAIWDSRNKRLLIARDRLGKKPLYYYLDSKRIIFASEIKAILQDPSVPREVELTSLSDYLSLLYVPAPKTIYKDIFKLPPGHYMLVNPEGISIKQYWDIQFDDINGLPEHKLVEILYEKMTDATRVRLISDVPLGAFLSGGIDSSTVVALMTQLSNNGVTTASIGFQEKGFDELQHSRNFSQRFQTRHHEYVVKPNAVEILPKLVWHLDEPHADSSAIPTFYVSKMARQQVTVALSGDGGDENFAGYTRRYYYDRLENKIRSWIPQFIRRPVFGILSSIYPKADWLPRSLRAKILFSNLAISPERGFFNTMIAIPDSIKLTILSDSVKDELKDYDTFHIFQHHFGKCNSKDPLTKVQYVDMKTFMVDDILMKVDKMSMANSLEVRCPLLDQELVEFIATIPSNMKLKGWESKYILKQTMRKHLPQDLLRRPKHGFEIPANEWLRTDLQQFAYDAIFSSKIQNDFFEMKFVKRIWNAHQKGVRDWSAPLWALMVFGIWNQIYMTQTNFNYQ